MVVPCVILMFDNCLLRDRLQQAFYVFSSSSLLQAASRHKCSYLVRSHNVWGKIRLLECEVGVCKDIMMLPYLQIEPCIWWEWRCDCVCVSVCLCV